jgi:hypothetical protein
VAIAGCGSSTGNVQQVAQDATGGAASDDATLVREANFKKALDVLSSKLGSEGAVNDLKLEPKTIKVVGVANGGQGQVLVINGSGNAIATNSPALGMDSFPVSQINPAVPEKILSQVSGATLQDVDYYALTVDPISKKPEWELFLLNGKGTYQAALDGSGVHKLGSATSPSPSPSPSAPSPTTLPAPAPSPSPSAPSGGGIPDPQKLQQCIANAGGDPQKIAKCATQ